MGWQLSLVASRIASNDAMAPLRIVWHMAFDLAFYLIQLFGKASLAELENGVIDYVLAKRGFVRLGRFLFRSNAILCGVSSLFLLLSPILLCGRWVIKRVIKSIC